MFRYRNFKNVGYNNSETPAVYSYETTEDTIAQVSVSGYFSDPRAEIREGDLIIARCTDGSTTLTALNSDSVVAMPSAVEVATSKAETDRLALIKPAAEGVSLADITALALAGKIAVGSKAKTSEYHEGTGYGGGEFYLRSELSAEERPEHDGGRYIHIGDGGLYWEQQFPNVKIYATQFGLKSGAASAEIMQNAIDFCATQFNATLVVPSLPSPALLDDDIYYKQGTRVEGDGFNRPFVEDTPIGSAFIRTVANKAFVIDGDFQGERLRWCTMNHLSIDGGGLAGDIVKIRKVQNFRQKNCQISNTPNRTVWIRDIYDSWFEENYYQRAGTTGGVSESFHLDDSLGTSISHNNNVRFSGCTWEGNYGVPLLIDGKGTGVGNSQIVFTNKCKLENLQVDDYQLKVIDCGAIVFNSLLVVSKGTGGTAIDAQMYFENVKNVQGSFDIAHSSGGATLNSVVKFNGYSRSVFELYPAESNVIDGLVGSVIFDNSTGAYDSRTELVCMYMGSKSLVTNNTTNDRFQPLGIDVSGPVGLRLRRNGATNANNLIHHDGGTNGDIYHGINAAGEFVVSTSSDPSASQIFKVDRNGTPSSGATQLTVGAAGGASALPALPSGYVKIKTSSGDKVIPFFNVS